jgi:hypothetical protein
MNPRESAPEGIRAKLGLGALRHPALANLMQETLLKWDGDRYIRDGDHFDNVRAYIEKNPVAAGLCKQASDWPWSSAFLRSASPGNAEPQLGASMKSQ